MTTDEGGLGRMNQISQTISVRKFQEEAQQVLERSDPLDSEIIVPGYDPSEFEVDLVDNTTDSVRDSSSPAIPLQIIAHNSSVSIPVQSRGCAANIRQVHTLLLFG